MERFIQKELLKWCEAPSRMPLLIRGARQVGKTYSIEQLGAQHFSETLSINFELQPEYAQCFETLEPQKIIDSISAITQRTVTPGKTLLFLDEIQECPRAIMALRYFKEKYPQLHVVGAGSLLEFALRSEDFRMPVGRVQSLYLRPLSFHEYLHARGYSQLSEAFKTVTLTNPLPSALAHRAEELLREYFVIGGMPAVVDHYTNYQDLAHTQILQASLLNTYRSDFGKYANQAQHKYLQKILDKAPGMIGQHFRYSKIDPDMQSRDLKVALENLVETGVMYRVYSSKASGLPLGSLINEKKFKVLFLDIGLAKSTRFLNPELMLEKDLMVVNHGMLVEQFVGQELLAYRSPHIKSELFFWVREKHGSQAEVDYVINVDDAIIPIEVKAGKTGTLRSLRSFITERQSKLGVRISLQPLSLENNVLSVPLYMVNELERLIHSVLD